MGKSSVNLPQMLRYLREVAFECELTKEIIHLPLGCLQGGLPDHQTPPLPHS